MSSSPVPSSTAPSFLSEPLSLRDAAFPLAALCVIAGIVRAHAWSQTVVLFNDGPIFLALADAAAAGEWSSVFAHPYHPLYPSAIAFLSQWGLTPERAGVAVSIFGGLLSVVAIFVLLNLVWGRNIAWLGAWMMTLHPWAVDFSSDVMSDGLYMGFYLAGFAAFVACLENPTGRAAVVCGACAALAFWTRPEGLGLVPIALGTIAVKAVVDRDLRLRLRPLGLLLVACAVVVGPYVAWLSADAGEWTWTQKKSVTELVRSGTPSEGASKPASPAADRPLWLPQSVRPAHSSLPTRSARGVIDAVSRVIRTSTAAIRYEVVAFGLFGCLVLYRARRRAERRPWPLLALGLSILLYSALLVLLVWGAGYVSRRHALAFWLPTLGLAAIGWQAMATTLIDRVRGSDRDPRLVCLLLVAVLVLIWGPRDVRERRGDRTALRDAARWIALEHSESGPVAAEKLRLAYYAEKAFVPLAAAPGQTLEETLRAAAARWIVVDSTRVDRITGLSRGVGKWITLVHTVGGGNRRAHVYEMVPASH